MMNRIWHERSRSCAARLSGLLTVLLLPAGCGPSTLPVPEWAHVQSVRGTVALANGQPVGRGKVVLTPQQEPKEPLSGWLDSDGTFTLMESQGLAISHGDFLVHVEPPPAHAGLAKAQKGQQQVPSKYQKPETSTIKVTIGPDTKQLPPIVLK